MFHATRKCICSWARKSCVKEKPACMKGLREVSGLFKPTNLISDQSKQRLEWLEEIEYEEAVARGPGTKACVEKGKSGKTTAGEAGG